MNKALYALSCNASWSHDGKELRWLIPGDRFHHDSFQPCTMQTFEYPLLSMGFYLPPPGWEGGLLDAEEL